MPFIVMQYSCQNFLLACPADFKDLGGNGNRLCIMSINPMWLKKSSVLLICEMDLVA